MFSQLTVQGINTGTPLPYRFSNLQRLFWMTAGPDIVNMDGQQGIIGLGRKGQKRCRYPRTILEKLPAALAFCYKQLVSNAPETDALEEGMASSALNLTSETTVASSSHVKQKCVKPLVSSFPHSCHQNTQMFRCHCLSEGTPALLTRKTESKQMIICLGDKVLPGLKLSLLLGGLLAGGPVP